MLRRLREQDSGAAAARAEAAGARPAAESGQGGYLLSVVDVGWFTSRFKGHFQLFWTKHLICWMCRGDPENLQVLAVV